MPRLFTALACLALLVSGCDTGTDPDCVVGTDPACTPAGQDDVVAGVNLTALFAAPTDAERDSVAARLARAEASPIADMATTELSVDPRDGTRYVLLDLRASDGRSVAFALARVPALNGGSNTLLPVVFLLPDGSGDASGPTDADPEGDFLTGLPAGGLDRETVQIAVAFRGATLTTRDGSYTSEVAADPYRGDAVDLLALADRLADVPRAYPTRLGAVGVGRGGAVALLAAERQPGRFRAVAPLGAPTSLFDATFRTAARNVLRGLAAPPLPAAGALLAPVLALRDGQIGLAEARLRLLELSAVALADRLPATRAFHADPDDVVPVSHLARLREEGEGTFDDPRRFVPVPEGDHATLLTPTGSVRGEVAAFLLAEFSTP